MNRHEVALDMLENIPGLDLAGMARSLAAAADQAASEGIGAERDPAVRVIAYRLARLCRVDEISYGYDQVTLADTFCALMNECKTRAQERELDEIPLPLEKLNVDKIPRKLSYDQGRPVT